MQTLAQFQRSGGIPLQEQIILLRNPVLFEAYRRCARILPKPPWLRWLNWQLDHYFGFMLPRRFFLNPGKHNRLYLGTHEFSLDPADAFLPKLYRFLQNHPQRQFEVLMGKSDYEWGEDQAAALPANVRRLTANNVNSRDPRLKVLPMGRDFRNPAELHALPPVPDKDWLCYCNFSLTTWHQRGPLWQSLQSLAFLDTAHMGPHGNYTISRSEFMQQLGRSRFSLCPRGNAIDTFRLWDSLYLGTIPVVVREAVFHQQLDDLPILFIDDISDYPKLTAEYLESVYQDFLQREFNFEKLKISHWLN